ncbi:hypothetical protein [Pararhizobium gei]|uniref:hypothetical protein n=1 Tax=Pararhizobium gei TaxID=1395951 RepID=UPI0023DC0EDB|nr:hypothetical protein [Rhizobium gei]
MCHDRVDGDHLQLTHEFLSLMLGLRRSEVTDHLHKLEGLHSIAIAFSMCCENAAVPYPASRGPAIPDCKRQCSGLVPRGRYLYESARKPKVRARVLFIADTPVVDGCLEPQ